MKELLDGFSVERLEALSSRSNVGAICGDEIVSLARIALALKQAKPYGYVHQRIYEDCGCVGLSNDHEAHWDSDTHIPLYQVPPTDAALQNFRSAMEGIGHIRRTLEETFGGLHGTHCEPDVLAECKAICDAICDAYRKAAAPESGQ